MNRVWIPGWQCSSDAFKSLWAALGVEHEAVLSYENTDLTRQQWVDEQAKNISPETTLIGWSLGGMLACELAAKNANVSQVLVLNSNTQFAGGPGLEAAVADNFMKRYSKNPDITRKRFAALVDSKQPESMSPFFLPGDHLVTLKWLYESKVNELKWSLPVSVLLAKDDRLVPVTSATQAWKELSANVTCFEGEHSLPMTKADTVAQWVLKHG